MLPSNDKLQDLIQRFTNDINGIGFQLRELVLDSDININNPLLGNNTVPRVVIYNGESTRKRPRDSINEDGDNERERRFQPQQKYFAPESVRNTSGRETMNATASSNLRHETYRSGNASVASRSNEAAQTAPPIAPVQPRFPPHSGAYHLSNLRLPSATQHIASNSVSAPLDPNMLSAVAPSSTPTSSLYGYHLPQTPQAPYYAMSLAHAQCSSSFQSQNMYWATVLNAASSQLPAVHADTTLVSAPAPIPPAPVKQAKKFSIKVKNSNSKTNTNNVSLKCPRCPATFNQRSNLNKHVRTVHENLRPHVCDECGVAFGHKNLLVEHKSTAHRGERPYACNECGVTFGRRSNKYQHVQMVHVKKRSYECHICSMSFGLKGNLVKHIRLVHERQRPFACDKCPACFGLKSDLKRHKSTVHATAPPPPPPTSSPDPEPPSDNSNPTSSSHQQNANSTDGTSDYASSQPSSRRRHPGSSASSSGANNS